MEPNNRISAVILDMDGLMLDTEPIYKRASQKAASECGYEIDDEFYVSLVGLPTSAFKEALVRSFGRDFPLTEFSALWQRRWREDVEVSGIAVKPGLLELLSFLSENQLPVGIATSSDSHHAAFSLRSAVAANACEIRGLQDRFDCIVTGDQVAHGKPAPDIYKEAARRLGVDPKSCIALEDSGPGIMAASAAGMIAIMVPDLQEPSVAVRSAAHAVVESLFDAKEKIEFLLTG